MRKTINERIEAAKLEKEQAEARIKKLLQEQKTQERKDRNHRLCKRGGLVEKLLPDLIKLSDEQFQIFVDKTLLTKHSKNILAELASLEPDTSENQQGDTETAQGGDNAEPKAVEPQKQSNPAPAPKPTATAHNANANNNNKSAQAARVAG